MLICGNTNRNTNRVLALAWGMVQGEGFPLRAWGMVQDEGFPLR